MPEEVHARSIEQCPHYTDVEHEVLPLGPEGFDLQYRWARYGDLGLHSEFFGSRARFREVQHGDMIYFGLVIPSGDPVRFLGAHLKRPSLVAWHGLDKAEYDYVMEPGTSCYIVEVPERVARSRGWVCPPKPISEVCREAAEGFVRGMQTLMSRFDNQPSDAQLLYLEMILNSVDMLTGDALYQASSTPRSRASERTEWRIVNEAEFLLLEGLGNDALSGEDICKALGVPRRTLYSAFQNQLGIGPNRFQSLMRLYELRASLMTAPMEPGAVSRLAHGVGFSHLGRMSGAYRVQFGETPLETLRRHN